MRRVPLLLIVLAIAVSASASRPAEGRAAAGQAPGAFELYDGDRVVLLGNTLIERAQQYGWWETLLVARWPERSITFRNLGWDGDTVWAESRGIFDAAEKGYERLLEHVGRLRPTVILLGYGGNEAFAGDEGLPRFLDQYQRLMDDLANAAGGEVRFVILSPTRHEDLGPPLPDPAEANRRLAAYADALRHLAADRRAWFVDLFAAVVRHPRSGDPLTSNGLHLEERGYLLAAAALADQLLGVHAADGEGPDSARPPARTERIVAALFPGRDAEGIEALRRAVVSKNELYFHHWRPQNVTYLFGFRQHEQGQNAPEVEEFERLVTEAEERIRRLAHGRE